MTHSSPEISTRLEFALQAAREASELILGYYQSADLQVERKRDASPVTAADRGAEELIRARLEAAFPQDGVLGEEFGERPSSSGYRWILDPVDGTKSFMHGVPLFGTLIGVEYEGEMVIGLCRIPPLDEVVYAARGAGAWWQTGGAPPRRAQVSATPELADGLFCTTTITGWKTIGRQETFQKLCDAAGLTRGWSDCYGHLLVATGRADVMVDPAMNPWDIAALIPIMQEAGGFCGSWNGDVTIHGGNGVSCNAALRDEVLALLK